MLLENKIAIITGAAGGIGEETARVFAKEGAKVVLSDVDTDRGESAAEAVRAEGGEARFIAADVSDAKAVEALVRQTVEAYGRLDVMVNNAGIGGEQVPMAELSVEGWQQVIGINLSGVFYGMKYAIPRMLEHGGGAIVNVASILGEVGFNLASGYVAAKHGVVGLTHNAALEYSSQGIRVNAVAPGFIRTPLVEQLLEDEQTNQMLVQLHPIGRLGRDDEVANVIAFIASDRASFVTGAYIPVDGGYLAR